MKKNYAIKNRRGSYTVFLIIFFSALMILIHIVLKVSAQTAISSSVDHFGRLWGTSILAEYDLVLKDRYGLYGFYGTNAVIEEKLDQYAEYSFKDKSYIRFEGSVCSLERYSLSDISVLKDQIEDAVLMKNKPHEIKGTHDKSTWGSRRITSRWILENLPSAGSKAGADISAAVNSVKSGDSLKELIGSAAVNTYIFTYFRHYCSGEYLSDSYFQNEVEYILTGYPDDQRARKKIKQKLLAMRNMLNLAYLYTSDEKREAAMAMAAVLTPGAEAVVTQGVLLELWAYAEAENDLALLYDGKTVPLLKSSDTWALSLGNSLSGSEAENGTGKRYVLPKSLKGYGYEEYLRILLNVIPENLRYLRLMDLIQINMKYLYCDYFRLENYYAGLQYTLEVNGVLHEFEETYEREPKRELSG